MREPVTTTFSTLSEAAALSCAWTTELAATNDAHAELASNAARRPDDAIENVRLDIKSPTISPQLRLSPEFDLVRRP